MGLSQAMVDTPICDHLDWENGVLNLFFSCGALFLSVSDHGFVW
jgi:hypothetical protein